MLADDTHATRLLAITGITPEELRERLNDTVLLTEVLDFLMRHEPDLLACAAGLGVAPQALVAAHHQLAPPEWEP